MTNNIIFGLFLANMRVFISRPTDTEQDQDPLGPIRYVGDPREIYLA